MATKKSTAAKKIEECASMSLLSEVQHNMKQNSKKVLGGKNSVNDGNRCMCVKVFQQKGTAYESFLNGNRVFIVDKTVKEGGKKKSFAYGCCSFARVEGDDYCSRHMKQDESNRFRFDQMLEMLESKDASAREVTSIKDNFFDGMGTRGAKKKKDEGTYYDFGVIDHPILRALRHSNKQMIPWLTACALEMLHTNNPVVTASTSTYIISQSGVASSKTTAPKCSNDLNLSSMSSLMEGNDEVEEEVEEVKPKKGKTQPAAVASKPKAKVVEPEPEPEESDAETEKAESSDDEDEDEDEEDDEEDDGKTKVVKITTDKGVDYALNPEDMEVYDIDSFDNEDGPTTVGVLMEMKKKYSKVEHDGKYYSICKEMSDDDRELILCVLSDRVFDPESKECVGKLKKKKGSLVIEYREDK
jgi:hypothetical protein